MEQRLKQRLVGATVLVGLIVIVVPELFDDQSSTDSAVSQTKDAVDEPFISRIVPLDEDDVVSVAVVEVQPVEVEVQPAETVSSSTQSEDVSSTSTAQNAETEQPVPATKVPIPRRKPPIRDATLNVGLTTWVVQLASFSDSSRALSLRDELIEQGYAAFIQTAANDTGTFSRVYVGPELEEDNAKRLLDRLVDQTKLKGQVVRYPG
jgi:DedD protein